MAHQGCLPPALSELTSQAPAPLAGASPFSPPLGVVLGQHFPSPPGGPGSPSRSLRTRSQLLQDVSRLHQRGEGRACLHKCWPPNCTHVHTQLHSTHTHTPHTSHTPHTPVHIAHNNTCDTHCSTLILVYHTCSHLCFTHIYVLHTPHYTHQT